MGAMRALEWSVDYPERVERAVILAVSAAASAEQIALCSLQVRAINPIRRTRTVTTTHGTKSDSGLRLAPSRTIELPDEHEFDLRLRAKPRSRIAATRWSLRR